MSKMANRVSSFGTTVFAEMTRLANQHNAINLGQGFPDFAAPQFLKEAAKRAIDVDINQYAPGKGRARLRNTLAAKMKKHYGMDIDPETEITILHGATEAIFASIMGLVNPGDEVILFEPFYDSYVPSTIMANGVVRAYTLRPPDWAIDRDTLAALFNEKTKVIVVNTPHNPTGKVFSRDELAMIAELCVEHDVIAMTDEVYEHLVYNGRFHTPLATFPGMADRTVTISSLGKTFSTTGWKVGWTIAQPELNQAVFRAHQFITYSGAAPLQEAAADALEVADDYYEALKQDYTRKRDFLVKVLEDVGLKPIMPDGTYFVMTDIREFGFADDVAFCHYLTKEIGVAAIPPSAFYANPADGAGLARFAFCKSDETLERAAERLQKLKK
jgi:aspartate/methionine/tyrosine aminotransferase